MPLLCLSFTFFTHTLPLSLSLSLSSSSSSSNLFTLVLSLPISHALYTALVLYHSIFYSLPQSPSLLDFFSSQTLFSILCHFFLSFLPSMLSLSYYLLKYFLSVFKYPNNLLHRFSFFIVSPFIYHLSAYLLLYVSFYRLSICTFEKVCTYVYLP